MSLTGLHPNTQNRIPELATHWAVAKDNQTVYYKLDPKARWSDGKAVTADDVFVQFMRSKDIVAPWYTTIIAPKLRPSLSTQLDYFCKIWQTSSKKVTSQYYNTPVPKHFHTLDKDWVKNYNWKVEPNLVHT